jgi:hypothetical protein
MHHNNEGPPAVYKKPPRVGRILPKATQHAFCSTATGFLVEPFITLETSRRIRIPDIAACMLQKAISCQLPYR